jgi:asparagine synthase (glutamine-hydrolysing)
MNALIGLFPFPERMRLYRSDHLHHFLERNAESYKYNQMLHSLQPDHLSVIQESDIQNYLVDDILTKTDISSMQNSIELRVPFLDHVFAEDTFKIPSSLKLKNGQTKYIFKKAFKGILPDSILTSPKKGFTVPLKYWFRGNTFESIHDNLTATDSPLYDFINPHAVKSLFSKSKSTTGNYGDKIWALIILDFWLRKNRL